MPRRCGIDTSILVRLCTGEPRHDFDRVVAALTHMVESEHVSLLASHMVIGEAYMALQHYFGITKADAKSAMYAVPNSRLYSPQNGFSVLEA